MKVGFSSSAMLISCKSKEGLFTINRNDLIPKNNYQLHEEVTQWFDFPYLLGIYSYKDVDFIIFVDKFDQVDQRVDIFEIRKIKIFQISPGEVKTEIMRMLHDSFSFNNFYFCDSRPLQFNFSAINFFDHSRDVFVWNLKPLIKTQEVFKGCLNQFTIPVINGSVAIYNNFCLISRRSNSMCGARFWLRGSDSEGNCANFIETESILFEANHKSANNFKSFIQIRGSIPLHWTEYPNLTFLPQIKVDQKEESKQRYHKHIKKIQLLYEKEKSLSIVNLTSKKGREEKLTSLFEQLCLNDQSISYVHIDTEQICGVLHWEKLASEIDKNINFDEFSFNEIRNGILIHKQKGIIRTNCADSIDRTNVTQCEISIHAFKKMKLKNFFENQIRECWYINGNIIAKQIVGSNALKGEITLYKHRTFVGLLKDAFESIIRFYYDNFLNGYRQDCLDCLTMNIDVIPANMKKKQTMENIWRFFVLFLLMNLYLVLFQIRKFKECKNHLKEILINKPRLRKIEVIDQLINR